MTKPTKYAILPGSIEAIQFTGKNGKDIVEWFNNSKPSNVVEQTIRNGGSYIKIYNDFPDSLDSGVITVTKGGMVARMVDGFFTAFSVEDLEDNYRVTPAQKAKLI